MNLSYRSLLLPLQDCLNLLGIDINSSSGHHMSQENHFLQPEFTFRELGIELSLAQSLQHDAQMGSMFIIILRINQDVIDEYYHKLIQVWMEHPVHKIHKNCRGISQTKRHHQKLIMPITRPEGSLRYILLLNPQLIVPRSQINLREYHSTS
ncbi:Uncharacterized protein TCM_003614 [Theobroma cacao]|uniref:Uncharacterized protein n=1 Tax=Theobroma cacao TaxID=3641 RepID=A0A061DN38_THECC|nr:Uncharacterized protein TCM_003614 [Theobroma cacao]